jgi:hypothetical protein
MSRLSYPKDLDPKNLDYCSFTAAEYSSNISGQFNPPIHTIVLYMPESTPPMEYGNTWNSKSFAGPMGKIVKNLVAQTQPPSPEDIAQAFGQGVATGVGGALNVSANQITALRTGKVYNPNIELLYDAPVLREFSFNFNFTPRNKAEAAEVREIIRVFKESSAPAVVDGGAMFEIPRVWRVKYKNSAMMGKFKQAALTSFTHQANANSAYHSTFDDEMPIQYSISLQFKETDILTREDFAGSQIVSY